MSIEKKIAELLAESQNANLAAQLGEDRVKPNGTETGASDKASSGAQAGDQSLVKKGDAVTPTDSGANPDNARNNVDDEDEAAGGTEKKSNPANSSAESGDQSPIRKGDAVKANVKEDVEALLNGEELSEEFKQKAETIFEAAVMTRVKSEVARLEEEFESKLQEATEKNKEGLVEQVDGYLGYIAEQWIAQNEIALERGMKSEILESFVSGMKSLFEEHYIEVPEERYDVLGEMQDTISSLEAKLNEQVASNVELTKQVAESQRAQIVRTIGEGLSDVEAEKFQGLVEELSYEDAGSFEKKVQTIRENYFTNKAATDVKSVVTDAPVDTLTEETVKVSDPKMSAYLSALSK
jgi:tRNA 2-selenouridine synthase SelU